MHGRQRLYRQMHDPGDLGRAVLAVDGVFDRHLLRSEILADQRSECRHGAARRPTEDGAQRRHLLVIGLLVDIGRQRPVALTHGARRMGDDGDVEAVQRYVLVLALVDVEDQGNVANPLAGSRRHRRAGRDQAWTDHVAIAVLEIVAGQLPLRLRRHLLLP
jgi:hypothetical protein